MAFSVTAFKAYGLRTEGATRLHAVQRASFSITALAADVAMDISATTAGSLGTFWTDVTGNTTYGSLAGQALIVIRAIALQVKSFQGIKLGNAQDYVQGTATASSTYTVAVNTHLPDVAFNAANGKTSYTVTLEWLLLDGKEPVISDLGAAWT